MNHMPAKARLFLYPFEHSNGVIARLKETFEDLGYELYPFKGLFRPAHMFSRSENWLVLNWYEDQPFRKGEGVVRRGVFLIAFVLTLLSLRLFSNKVVWVRHNYKPHNISAKSHFYRFVIWLLQTVADRIVTLEMTSNIDSSVVKHPLYFRDRDIKQSLNITSDTQRDTDFLYFGSIKPYKRLDKLLSVWPVDKALRVLGFCADKQYAMLLYQLIERRGLQVDWNNEFVQDETLEQAVSDTRFVIMAHDDNAMISSGTFYMAISMGANVLCFDSAFARMKAREFPFVKIIDAENLAEQLSTLQYEHPSSVLNQAVERYGEEAIRESWRVVLTP
ncbi:hypothetical protein [Aestuariibacter sp. A3R04]|uniref:hypothetical protein n=1 Tax=Aestuariibacter sp. A3R04 TaxID=2841571 RepID=UPI001C097078|nr:hypothetical protein [Aestuariibacter sp. A3R04]MBU3020867.1 hypothetical protein [Aestuariibacter sp. A3R04]